MNDKELNITGRLSVIFFNISFCEPLKYFLSVRTYTLMEEKTHRKLIDFYLRENALILTAS